MWWWSWGRKKITRAKDAQDAQNGDGGEGGRGPVGGHIGKNWLYELIPCLFLPPALW